MGKPVRVLFVDDDEADIALTAWHLRRGGFEPSFAAVQTKEDMEEVLRRKHFDVVICDCRVPRFSPEAALALLAAQAERVPLILVSGSVAGTGEKQALADGAAAFVDKNELERIAEVLERVLADWLPGTGSNRRPSG